MALCRVGACMQMWSLQTVKLGVGGCDPALLLHRYNCDNGGPAPEKLTNAIHQNTTKIKEYWIADESLQARHRTKAE